MVAVVIARDGEDRATSLEERCEGLVDVLECIREVFEFGIFGEEIARDEQHVRSLFLAQFRDAFDALLQVGGAVDST